MSSLQHLPGGGLPAPGGSLNHPPAPARKALAHLQQATIIQTARVQAQAYLGREAMYAVADISEMEGQLATLCPLATSRLEVIANITALSIARTISDFRA